MTKAENLQEFLILRKHTRDYMDSITQHSGRAPGWKNGDGDTRVIVFVPRKIKVKWLPGTQAIRDELDALGGLHCLPDVSEGGERHRLHDVSLMNATNTAFSGKTRLTTRKETSGSPLLSRRSRVILLQQLSGWTESAMPGARFYRANGWYGTLVYFATDTPDHQEFIKNQHVVGKKGDLLLFQAEGGMELGRVKQVVEQIACEARFPGIVNAPEASCKIDHAFADLPSEFSFSDIDSRFTPDDDRDNIVLAELGDPLPLDCQGPLSSHSRCCVNQEGGEKQKAGIHIRNGRRNEDGSGDVLCCHRNLRVFLAVRLRQRC